MSRSSPRRCCRRAPDGVPQVVCHLDGVGSGRGTGRLARALDRVLGGALGEGLRRRSRRPTASWSRLCARGRDPPLRLLARRLHRALARRADPQLRHPRAPHAARDPRGAGALPGAPAETGPDARGGARASGRAHAAHVTTGAAEAAWRAARGLPAGAPLADRLPRGLGHRRRARGAAGTCALARRLNRGLGFHDTTLSPAGRRRRGMRWRSTSGGGRFPPTLWDNLDALNAGAERRLRASAGSPATTARSAAAAR